MSLLLVLLGGVAVILSILAARRKETDWAHPIAALVAVACFFAAWWAWTS